MNSIQTRECATAEDFTDIVDTTRALLAPYFLVSDIIVAAGRSDDPNKVRLAVRKGNRYEVDEYIDLHSAFGATGPGNGNPEVCERVAREIAEGQQQVAAMFAHRKQAETLLALRDVSRIPDPQVFFCNDGTNATAVAMRLALVRHVRMRGEGGCIVGMEGGFHGSIDLARAVLRPDRSDPRLWNVQTEEVRLVPYGNIGALRAALGDLGPKAAGVIMEPVQGAAGCIVPPASYVMEADAECKARGVPLIVDEIKSGLGRCGEIFFSHASGARPDMICGGKSAGGGVVPFSFVVGRRDIMEGFKHTSYSVTWSASPPQCEGFLAWLDLLRRDGEALLRDIRRRASYLREQMDGLRKKHPERVVGYHAEGFMGCLETAFDPRELAEEMLKRGVFTRPMTHPDPARIPRNRVTVNPVLTITQAQIEEVARAFDASIAALEKRAGAVR